jgi:chromosome segregation protein
MRLKKIKIAGFKSFVDPIHVEFPQQMTAIVGPNGCGKSNIIDAVRWVLGESSAKNLRGESITDVIFNGSTSRQAIGQASVELFFDNSDASSEVLTPENIRRFSEISIRRLVNREGVNQYFLNGSKCRRKDVTDIFLGTGLGPRSYAIIEQGTISRLIESKPHELRVFIEEAAGISRYKERRRETENHIRHTQENLARLSDISTELLTQLDNLYSQSEAAKKYKQLKASEREYKAQLIVHQWHKNKLLQQKLSTELNNINAEITTLMATKQTAASNKVEQQRQLLEAEQQWQINQREEIELTKDLAQLEQKIAFEQERIAQNKSNLADIKTKINHNYQQLQQAMTKQQAQQSAIEQQQILCQQTQQTLTEVNQQLVEKQAELTILEHDWSEHQLANDTFLLEKNTAENTLQQLKQQMAQSKQKSQNIAQTITTLQTTSVDVEEQTLNLLTQQAQQLDLEIAQLNEQLQNVEMAFEHSNEQQLELAKQHALAIAQKTAAEQQQQLLQQKVENISDWQHKQQEFCVQKNLEIIGKVHQFIDVDAGWEHCVEQLLGYWLMADVVNVLPAQLATENLTQYCLVCAENCSDISNFQRQETKRSAQSILEKITFKDRRLSFIEQLLAPYLWAETKQQAITISETLAQQNDFASALIIICKDGTFVSPYALAKHSLDDSGIISNQASLNDLNDLLDRLQQTAEALEQQLQTAKQNQIAHKQAQQNYRQLLVKLTQQKQDVLQKTTLIEQANQLKLAQHEQQLSHLQKEQQLLEEQLTIFQQDVASAEQKLAALMADKPEVDNEKLVLKRRDYLTQVNDLQQTRHSLQNKNHELSLQLANLQNNLQQTQQNVVRLQQQEQSYLLQQQQYQHWQNEHSENNQQTELLNQLKKQQQQLTEKNAEFALSIAHFKQAIAQYESTDKTIESELSKHKEQAYQLSIEIEKAAMKISTADDQLAEKQLDANQILKTLKQPFSEAQQQAKIAMLSKDIARLGEINLAAINDYEKALERKSYIDEQIDDLSKAISTLESTIARIDKESKIQFKNTFDKINAGLNTLFPKVFSGGTASLTLTDDDYLEAGVTIMARPPGKKNSTIALLSGGEKALTALSLVFAIFQLNPAPFCMLDEVDAPLDDTNVARFCQLVAEMSQSVQFIYISHNKIAMEMASQLAGVTMVEPGVSKMVAVDIEEAIAMAENS